MINMLEFLGVGVVMIGQVTRSSPKQIKKSLIFSTVGSALLLVYTISTAQYGLVLLNCVSMISNAVGLHRWRKLKEVKNEK